MSSKTIQILDLLALGALIVTPAVAAESAEIARINAASFSYVVFAVSVTFVKITALVIGYLVVRLGYATMMAGVQGKDSAELKFAGAKVAFKGVTPGLALGLFGIFMMVWALSTKHHFSTEATATSERIEHLQGESGAKKPSPSAGQKAPETAVTEKDDVQKAPKFR
jgi:hypothetical protein